MLHDRSRLNVAQLPGTSVLRAASRVPRDSCLRPSAPAAPCGSLLVLWCHVFTCSPHHARSHSQGPVGRNHFSTSKAPTPHLPAADMPLVWFHALLTEYVMAERDDGTGQWVTWHRMMASMIKPDSITTIRRHSHRLGTPRWMTGTWPLTVQRESSFDPGIPATAHNALRSCLRCIG
jgi:hypothetical protein